MEGPSNLLGSILPIIIFVVIAGARILTSMRRQARKRDQGQKEEYRDPASPVTIEDAERGDTGDDDEFSAWSLSVNDGETPAPAKPAELPGVLPRETKKASVCTDLLSTASVSVSGEIPAWLQSPSPPVPPAESIAQPPEPRNPQTVGSVASRIRLLPPLQQGVIWAEILGTPKGL